MDARLIAAVLAASLALAIASSANAQPTRPRVEVTGDRATLDATKLDELIALELGADASRVRAVAVDVHGSRAEIDVRLGDDARRASVAIAATEPERALALFVAELARGTAVPEQPPSAAATAPPPPSAPPPTTPAPSEAERVAPPRSSDASTAEPLAFSLLATMGARFATSRGGVTATPHIELGARRRDLFRIGAIVRYGYASSDDALGTIRAHSLTGGVAGTYVVASGASLALATGPRLELGVIAGHGDGTNGEASSAFTFTGAWELELSVKLGAISLLGSVEGGSILRGIELRADDRSVLYLSGPFVGFALGAML